jgi:ADP-ribosylglycohydrolase
MTNYDNNLCLLIGCALGDALGVPHEFSYCKDKYTGKLQYIPKLLIRYKGYVYGTIGQFIY